MKVVSQGAQLTTPTSDGRVNDGENPQTNEDVQENRDDFTPPRSETGGPRSSKRWWHLVKAPRLVDGPVTANEHGHIG